MFNEQGSKASVHKKHTQHMHTHAHTRVPMGLAPRLSSPPPSGTSDLPTSKKMYESGGSQQKQVPLTSDTPWTLWEKHVLLSKPRQAGLRVREAFGQERFLGPWRGRFNHAHSTRARENDRGGGSCPSYIQSADPGSSPKRQKENIVHFGFKKEIFKNCKKEIGTAQ